MTPELKCDCPLPGTSNSTVSPFCEFHVRRKPNRYAIYVGSQTAHCCFEFTVVDTTKPENYRDSDTGQLHFESLCECWTEDEAKLICGALNLVESINKAVAARGGKPSTFVFEKVPYDT